MYYRPSKLTLLHPFNKTIKLTQYISNKKCQIGSGLTTEIFHTINYYFFFARHHHGTIAHHLVLVRVVKQSELALLMIVYK